MDRANLLSDVALALGDMRVPIYSLSGPAGGPGPRTACPCGGHYEHRAPDTMLWHA